MKAPLVSIIIPAYRAGRYITETLESIRSQTHTAWEVLVCEDGIVDDTRDRVEAFAATTTQPVRLFQNPSNRGVSHSRNRLLDAAQGEFIAFIDADDLWGPNHLAHSLERMNAERTDWIIGGTNLLASDGSVIKRDILPHPLPLAQIPTRLLAYNFILTGAAVFSRRVFTDGLRFDPTLTIGEDLDLWIRVIAAGHRPSFSDVATFNYRKHPASATGDSANFAEGMAALYSKYLNNPIVDRRECRNGLFQNLTVTTRMTRRTQPDRSLRAARQLFRLHPLHPSSWLYLARAKLAFTAPPRAA
ncbi:MAG: glycosyltransferase [Opitutaceae bacterium]